MLYVSYNCFLGWSSAYPLRQLLALHDRYASADGSTEERVNLALTFSEAPLAAEPLYGKVAPNLDAKPKTIMGQNRNYLAHEYFNREWNCMYFTDVVALGKLDYATSAVTLDAVDEVNLGADGQAFLKGIEHPIMCEQAQNYFVNQQFHKARNNLRNGPTLPST